MLKNAMQRCYKAILIDKGKDYIHTKLILWYTDSKVPAENKQLLEQLIVDNLPKQDMENIMRTVADTYIEQGVEKGILQGMEKGIEKGKLERDIIIAKNLLLLNISLDTISSATGLSIAELQKLKSNS
jgi:predicted transposase/invertase (TIGR01784 family)